MAKAKKTFDRELMYKKIMPTGSRKTPLDENYSQQDEGLDDGGKAINETIKVDKIVINDESFEKSDDESVISINASSVYISSGLSYDDDAKGEITEKAEAHEDNIENIEAVKKEEIYEEIEEEKPEAAETEETQAVGAPEAPEKKEIACKRHNIMENLVMDRLDITMNKMSCCRCSRCRDDVAALALNSLKPIYVVADGEELKNMVEENAGLGLEVTSAILKAVLKVRKSPRHE